MNVNKVRKIQQMQRLVKRESKFKDIKVGDIFESSSCSDGCCGVQENEWQDDFILHSDNGFGTNKMFIGYIQKIINKQ